MKTQVAIIGGGPSGLLLSQLLHTRAVDADGATLRVQKAGGPVPVATVLNASFKEHAYV